MKEGFLRAGFICVLLANALSSWNLAVGETEAVSFESDRWELKNGRIVDHLGQKALVGQAVLKDIQFENGVIEVDISCKGNRTFAGILFRVQSEENFENFYVRPHKSNLPDALQYQPVINRSSTWQLYSGTGYTAAAQIPHNEWFHVKMEISGNQARVFIGESAQPALVVTDLQHGKSKGQIGVSGPPNGLAHFANFSYRIDDELDFDKLPQLETPYGMITTWEISQPIKLSQMDLTEFPKAELLSNIQWESVHTEPSGLLNISRFRKRSSNEPEVVFARTTLEANTAESRQIDLGYSDVISVYLNGKIIFTGLSEFRRRDETFTGVAGLNDSLYLPLNSGENQLVIAVAETFGGWGLLAREGQAEYLGEGIEQTWETEKSFPFPESVIFDPVREVLYVSCFDQFQPSSREGLQSISRVSLEGEVLESSWVSGLRNPTGLVLVGRRLMVVERGGLVEIDPDTAKIVRRIPIKGAVFPNDITVDQKGRFYVSDSRRGVIFRSNGDEFESWVEGEKIQAPNGLWIDGDRLLVGTSLDHAIKSIDLETKEIKTLASFREGIMDGIKTDTEGNILFSHWEGRLYRLGSSGSLTKLIDTTAPEVKFADFEYIPEKNLIIVPTMNNYFIKAYSLE